MHIPLLVTVLLVAGCPLSRVDGQHHGGRKHPGGKKVCYEVPEGGEPNATTPGTGPPSPTGPKPLTPPPTGPSPQPPFPPTGPSPQPPIPPTGPQPLTPPTGPPPHTKTPSPGQPKTPSTGPSPPPTTPSSVGPTFPKTPTVGVKQTDPETRNAVNKMKRGRWPDKEVPIVFHPQFHKKQITPVKKAIERMMNLTCIRFKDLTGRVNPEDRDTRKVVINSRTAGCYANLGYNEYVKTTKINLERGCFSPSLNTILHELSHVLGIIHTQSRFDRDGYLTVHFEMVQRGREPQFKKREGTYGNVTLMGIPYDYNSIMHYPTTAFAKDPKLNTMSIKRDFPGIPGNPKTLTRSDVATINRLYECMDHYLGDDIAGAMPYKVWREMYLL